MSDEDPVEELFDAWRRERPDIDTDAMISVGRLMFAARTVMQRIEENAARYGLTMSEGDVLFTLRRSGKPYRVLPSQLSARMFVSSGTLTGRLDKLEKLGLIERVPNPDDRRSLQVQLTARGLKASDVAVTRHAAMEAEILAPFSARERSEFDRLMKKLLAGLAG